MWCNMCHSVTSSQTCILKQNYFKRSPSTLFASNSINRFCLILHETVHKILKHTFWQQFLLITAAKKFFHDQNLPKVRWRKCKQCYFRRACWCFTSRGSAWRMPLGTLCLNVGYSESKNEDNRGVKPFIMPLNTCLQVENEGIPCCSIWACYKVRGKCEKKHLQTLQPSSRIEKSKCQMIQVTHSFQGKDVIFDARLL